MDGRIKENYLQIILLQGLRYFHFLIQGYRKLEENPVGLSFFPVSLIFTLVLLCTEDMVVKVVFLGK